MDEEMNKENKGTTVFLKHDAYLLIRKKQMEIFDKCGKDVNIQDIVYEAIKEGVSLIKF